MMWRAMDPTHPAYTEADAKYRRVVEDLYVEMDGVVGRTAAALGPERPAGRDVRSRLRAVAARRESQQLAARPGLSRRDQRARGRRGAGLAGVDWTKTRAYAVGLNGLYVNTAGPRGQGHRPAGERAALAAGDRGAAADGRRSGHRPAGRDPGVRARAGVRRPRPSRSVARHRRRLRARHPGVERLGARHRRRPTCSATTARRGAATTAWTRRTCPGVLFTSRPLKVPAPGLQTAGRVDPRRVRRHRLSRYGGPARDVRIARQARQGAARQA